MVTSCVAQGMGFSLLTPTLLIDGLVENMPLRLCPLPVRRMKTGAASRSIIEHMGSLVICRAEGRHFSVIAPRSFAGSLHHALMAAARSIA